MFITTAGGGGALAATALGGLLGGASGGSSQGGTTTQSRDPWSAAQPWMIDNINKGQTLQKYYAQNPFNAQQQGAYRDLSQGNAYMKELVPSLLQQFSNTTGFDRTNPQAKPQAINFNTPNLGFGNVQQQAQPQQQAAPVVQQAQPQAAAPDMTQLLADLEKRRAEVWRDTNASTSYFNGI